MRTLHAPEFDDIVTGDAGDGGLQGKKKTETLDRLLKWILGRGKPQRNQNQIALEMRAVLSDTPRRRSYKKTLVKAVCIVTMGILLGGLTRVLPKDLISRNPQATISAELTPAPKAQASTTPTTVRQSTPRASTTGSTDAEIQAIVDQRVEVLQAKLADQFERRLREELAKRPPVTLVLGKEPLSTPAPLILFAETPAQVALPLVAQVAPLPVRIAQPETTRTPPMEYTTEATRVPIKIEYTQN